MRSRGLLAFAIGICVTIATGYMVATEQRAQVRANFQRDADKVTRDT
jgi:hypothetical protein